MQMMPTPNELKEWMRAIRRRSCIASQTLNVATVGLLAVVSILSPLSTQAHQCGYTLTSIERSVKFGGTIKASDMQPPNGYVMPKIPRAHSLHNAYRLASHPTPKRKPEMSIAALIERSK